jgi:drug/metabolite transporter (DMT)-like permease
MFIGLLCALGACFVWGLIFIIPGFLEEYSPIEMALGRYFTYGCLSLILLFRRGVTSLKTISLRVWGQALIYGLISNVLYYMGIVMGLRYASAPVTVLILGMCPILVALYGNWQVRECQFRALLFPSLCMIFGIVLTNISEIDWSFQKYSFKQYFLGLISAFGALISWGWYAVHNARFLKKNPQIPRSEWSTLIGVSTLIWVLVFGCILYQKQLIHFERYNPFIFSLAPRFLLGISILGFVCSWIGCTLWNHASSLLPISLMGSLIIFETLFGLMFVYLTEFQFPSTLEWVGITSMLGGIFLSIYSVKKQVHI